MSERTVPRNEHCVPVTPQLPVHLPSRHLPSFLSPYHEGALKDRRPHAYAVSVHAEQKERLSISDSMQLFEEEQCKTSSWYSQAAITLDFHLSVFFRNQAFMHSWCYVLLGGNEVVILASTV